MFYNRSLFRPSPNSGIIKKLRNKRLYLTGRGQGLQRLAAHYAAMSPDKRERKLKEAAERDKVTEIKPTTKPKKRDKRERNARRDQGLPSKYTGEQMPCPACKATFSRCNYKRGVMAHLGQSTLCYEWVQSNGSSKQKKYLPSRSHSK